MLLTYSSIYISHVIILQHVCILPLGMFEAVLPFAGIHGDDAGPINVHVHGDDNAPNEGPVVLSSMACRPVVNIPEHSFDQLFLVVLEYDLKWQNFQNLVQFY